jgi:hypothetical protein
MFTTRLLLVAKKTGLKSIKNIKKLNLSHDFSTNSPSGSNSDEVNFSAFSVKKSLKLAALDFHEGPTNLKINSCPVCMRFNNDPSAQQSSSIYINKTTGN